MATTKVKAEGFIKAIQKAESEALNQYGIDRNDVQISVRVSIEERVFYNNHEDED